MMRGRAVKGVNTHRFAEGMGIRVVPCRRARRERAPNTTHAIGTLRQLLIREGEEHTRLVCLCVQASDPTALVSDVLRAVSIVLRGHPERFQSRQEAVAWFRGIDLARLRERAQRLNAGPQPLAALLADRMLGDQEDAACRRAA